MIHALGVDAVFVDLSASRMKVADGAHLFEARGDTEHRRLCV
ncbi:MAG: hypothetical protein P4M05_09900 [Bradyrhizobium sp.]|nr:hypothetical protein [Bradyrhizobium sp.]